VIGEHHLKELPVETVGAGFDFSEVEPRLEIEIVGDRAVLEVEIDQAGRGFRTLAAAVEQQHRGLHGERGDAGAADRGQEGVDLRVGAGACGARIVRRLRAGAHNVERLHRLHQEIGDAHLYQCAGGIGVERLRHGDDRRLRAGARHEPRQRRHFSRLSGVEVGDDDGHAVDVERIGVLVERARDETELDRIRRAEGRAHSRREGAIRRDHQNPRVA
jgi:hypothetical protein